jgi:hypothetical protein
VSKLASSDFASISPFLHHGNAGSGLFIYFAALCASWILILGFPFWRGNSIWIKGNIFRGVMTCSGMNLSDQANMARDCSRIWGQPRAQQGFAVETEGGLIRKKNLAGIPRGLKIKMRMQRSTTQTNCTRDTDLARFNRVRQCRLKAWVSHIFHVMHCPHFQRFRAQTSSAANTSLILREDSKHLIGPPAKIGK